MSHYQRVASTEQPSDVRRGSNTALLAQGTLTEDPSLRDEPAKPSFHHHRYIFSVIALTLSLISFVVQTEATGYIANTLHYRKPFLNLYLTHSSYVLLWPCQILFLKARKPFMSFDVFFKRHLAQVSHTARIVADNGITNTSEPTLKYMLKTCIILFVALNIGGSAWYVAVNLTTPGDLTAIYNCSAFFAYAFSVPILKEPFMWNKMTSVALSIVGVFVVAYSGGSDNDDADTYPYRALGNIIIGCGSVMYGLYEVLYKRIGCPPNNAVSPRREASFANVVGSGIGVVTLLGLWPLLVLFHFTGIETFEAPRGKVLGYLCLSVFANTVFSGSFLILMALTSPVLSSVAALLTTFLVAIVDWLLFGTSISFGGFIGGSLIVSAFILLAYASWQDLQNDGPEDEDDEDAQL